MRKYLLFFLLFTSPLAAQTHTFCASDSNCNYTGTNTYKNSNSIRFVDAVNSQGWSGSDIGAWVNSAIQSLPSAFGGAVSITGLVAGNCATQSTSIVFDRPVSLLGQASGYDGRGTCIRYMGGAAPIFDITVAAGAAAGSMIQNLTIETGGSCTWAVDIDNNQYEIALRDVYITNPNGTACSGGGIRVGNSTISPVVESTMLDRVHIDRQPINLQILRTNKMMCKACRIYWGTTANIQIGDNTHPASVVDFEFSDVQMNAATPSVIVNYVESLTFIGTYTETLGANWMQIPNTANTVHGVRIYSGRFQCNAVSANIFAVNLASAELTVDGGYSTNCPAGSAWVQNTSSRRVWLNDLSSSDNNIALWAAGSVINANGPLNLGGTQVDPAFNNILPITDQVSNLGSATQRWNLKSYQISTYRSGGSSGFPDIIGNGAAPVLIGDAQGSRIVPAASNFIQNSAGTVFQGMTLKKGSGGGNYTTANTTYTVADSTNLCFTVTIPIGWKLSIDASGALGTATAAVQASIAITDNAACSTANAGILVESTTTGTAAGVLEGFSLNWVITGDGNSHNVALQYKTSAGADSATIQNSSATALPIMVFTLMPSN